MDKNKKKKRTSKAKKSEQAVDDHGIPRPKRFLTAYNFFFMRERAAVINAETAESVEEKISADPSKPWTKKKGKRQHVKTHGKIEFGSLGKLVAARWKNLSPEERKVYADLAAEDLARYRRELKEYKEKVAAMTAGADDKKALHVKDYGSGSSASPEKLPQSTTVQNEKDLITNQLESKDPKPAAVISSSSSTSICTEQVQKKMRLSSPVVAEIKPSPAMLLQQINRAASSAQMIQSVPAMQPHPGMTFIPGLRTIPYMPSTQPNHVVPTTREILPQHAPSSFGETEAVATKNDSLSSSGSREEETKNPAAGVTLKAWIESASSVPCDHEKAIRLAQAITKAVGKMHDSGVINEVTTENIMVDADQNDSCFSIRIFDPHKRENNRNLNKQADLVSLGAVFFELFSGKAPSADISSLSGSKIPPCLSRLVFDLMEKKIDGTHHYQSASDVDRDLSTILENRYTLLSCTKDNEEQEEVNPHSNFQTKKLHGRNAHMLTMMDAYGRVAQSENSSSEILVVTGCAGAGKTTLVHHLQKPVREMGGYFLCGKYDCFRQMEPLSAIIHAFGDFCNDIIKRDSEDLHRIKASIEEIVGSEANVLADLIPGFTQLISVPAADTVRVNGKEKQLRLKYVFQLFVRAIATPTHPLVLFLDDLQWADLLSLDLIESLITDTDNKSLLLIGSYRTNEVNTSLVDDRFTAIEKKGVTITNIKVGNLNKEHTNELISDVIQTSPQLTESLTDAVYDKTNGNVLFVLQSLGSLYDEGLLYYSSESRQWQWNVSKIGAKSFDDDPLALLVRKISHFPAETQSALKLLACLGNACEGWILTLIAAREGICAFGCTDLIASLRLAVEGGLLSYTGSTYKFQHDHIQLAAYSIIPENERSKMHFWIGSQVWANKDTSPEKALFIAVGQFNKCSMFADDSYQSIQVARLNLQAGEKSLSLAAFVPAVFYLKRGINLLDSYSWVEHYDMSLRLHTLYAEAQYCLGEFEEMNKMLTEVFANANCIDDKLDAYISLIGALVAQGKPREALDAGLLVLSQLGETIPTNVDTNSIIMVEFAKAKQLLDGKTDSELLNLKTMDDRQKNAAVRLMNLLALTSFFAFQEILCLLALRVVQLSLHHGICNESALAFASFGSIVGIVFKDIDGAYRFGQLALRFLQISQAKECLPGVFLTVYCLIFPLIDHPRSIRQPLENAFKTGMRCGNVNFAMSALTNHSINGFFCGDELSTVEKTIVKEGEIILAHRQQIFMNYALPFRQAVLNLMGFSDDPVQLTGDAMNQEEMLDDARKANRNGFISIIYHLRCWLAYLFGDYELASQMVEARQANDVLINPPLLQVRYLFVEGLIALQNAHQTDQPKWNTVAQKSMTELERYASHAPSNFQHMFLLLQAESDSLAGKYESASRKYDDAVFTAGENGYTHDQALAYERAGIFYSKQKNVAMASSYFFRAQNTYLRWGARCKADHVDQFIS